MRESEPSDMLVPLLETNCGNCRLLVIDGDLTATQRYSCPRNRKIPEFVPSNWATECSTHEPGNPVTKQMREHSPQRNPVFFTEEFGIRLTPDYRTIVIVAKKGRKLALDPSQTSNWKMVVTTTNDESQKPP